MTFDWFMLAAQLVNFGVLVVLLRVFLYRPVLGVMQAREERLAAAWREVETARAEVRGEASAVAAERKELGEGRKLRLAEVETEASQARDRLLRRAREEAELEGERLRSALDADRERIVATLAERSALVIVSELEATLADLTGANATELAAERFAERLQRLPDDALRDLRSAAAGVEPVVTSPAPLGEGTLRRLSASVASVLPNAKPLVVSTDPSLLVGVELRVGALRVASSARERLERLEEVFGAALDEAVGGARDGHDRTG